MGAVGDELSLGRVRDVAARESGLAFVVTRRADGGVNASVVNAGVLAHPVTGEDVVGFVARGHARKLPQLRADPRITVVWRVGWEWVAVEGRAELAGPDDPHAGMPATEVPSLLRAVYAAAVGGKEDDWVSLDEAMATERHTAVLIRPARVYGSGS